jgi:AraC-like DNA-binding protein
LKLFEIDRLADTIVFKNLLKYKGRTKMAKKKTHNEFIKQVLQLTNNEYIVIDQYIDAKTMIRFKHNDKNCSEGFTKGFLMTPNRFLNGQRCTKCRYKRSHEKTTKTHDQFIHEVFQLVGNKYEVLSKYNGTDNTVNIKHVNESCGYYEYSVTPNKFLTGRRCPKCSYMIRAKDKRKGLEKFKEEVFNVTNGEYIVLGDSYINNQTKIKIRHINNSCENHSWDIKPNNFLNGQRCPICLESKGARRIRLFLQTFNIKFEREYTFDDLLGVNDSVLRFDFAIFNEDGSLSFLIEYDGEFHDKQIHEGHDLETQQYHDRLKDAYTTKNKINLVRISYREQDDIENILRKVFKLVSA